MSTNPGPQTLDSGLWTRGLSDWDAVGAVLLIGALMFAVLISLGNSREVEGRFSTRQAISLLSDGRLSEAATLMERTLPYYGSPDAHLAASYAYLARRDGELAERQARLAVAEAPPDLKPAAWAQLGRVLSFNGNEADALAAWQQARQSVTRYPGFEAIQAEARSATWHTAISYWVRGDFGSARRHLEALLDGDDIYSASALIKLAQLQSPESNVPSPELANDNSLLATRYSLPGPAIPNLRVPGLREGLSPEATTRIAGELERAAQEASKAEESAGEAGLSAFWGRAFLSQGEPHLAKHYLQEAVKLRPDVSDFHSYLALALLEKGEQERAISHLQEAIRLAPDRPLPRHIVARVYMAREEWDPASEQLSALKRLEPAGVEMYLQLGDYYTLRSAYGNAEEAYIEAVKEQRKPGKRAGTLDAALALARYYTDVRGLGCDRGLPAAQESLSNHQGDPASLDAVGWALVLCKSYEEALSTLEAAVKAAPEVARYRYHLARAYAGLGRADDAREQYRRVADLDPKGQWEQLAIKGLAELPGE